MQVQSLVQGDPLEEGTEPTLYSCLENAMTEESSELQSKRSQSQTRLKRLSTAAQASKCNAI